MSLKCHDPEKLVIRKPCPAKWSEMNSTARGKYCQECQREVLDLTRKTKHETLKILREHRDPCVRIRQSRSGKALYRDSQIPERSALLIGIVTAIIPLLGAILFITTATYADERVSTVSAMPLSYVDERVSTVSEMLISYVEGSAGALLMCTLLFASFVTVCVAGLGIRAKRIRRLLLALGFFVGAIGMFLARSFVSSSFTGMVELSDPNYDAADHTQDFHFPR